LGEREKWLSIYIKSNLLPAIQNASMQVIEEGLLYDILTDEEYEPFINRRCRETAQQVGERMGRYRRNREGSYDLRDLADHYKALHPKWKLAIRDAKSAQKHTIQKNRWRKRIYEDYELPIDLIEWLNLDSVERERKLKQHDSYYQLRRRRKSSTASDDQQYELRVPRDLALEHAARLCGAPPYSYSVTHLKDLVNSGKAVPGKKQK
jgi:hypothetical protein